MNRNAAGNGCGGGATADGAGTTRVVFFDGQRLEADDLNGATDEQRQLRWLHNRSLHGWGIGLGFEASGAAGDRHATVQPGYAVDCLGRELVLSAPTTLAVPTRSDNGQGQPVPFALVAAYPSDEDLVAIETRAVDCGGTRGAVRLRESAKIYWREPPVHEGIEVLLATALVQNCRLVRPLSVDQTRRARGIRTPYVAAGQTATGEPAWVPWLVEPKDSQSAMLGVTARVQTTSARFVSPPVYQAEVRGPRLVTTRVGDTAPPILLDGSMIVADPSSDGFTAYVLMPQSRALGGVLNPEPFFAPGTNGQTALINYLRAAWTVAWVGVEA
jgi:hypothetical protein